MREIKKKSSAKAVLELAEKIHDLTVRSVWTGTRCLPGWWRNEITVHRYIVVGSLHDGFASQTHENVPLFLIANHR